MGRELGINRIDILKDGTAIIRKSDFNLCGRTSFTNAIAQLFYNHDDISYLFIGDGDENASHTIHVSNVEDDYWCEKEFDLEYAFINRDIIQYIVNEHMDEDDKELTRERDLIYDARCARQHVTNLKDFEEFSSFIDELQEHIEDYREEAKYYIEKIISIEEDMNNKMSYDDTIKDSYIMISISE